MDSFDTYNYGTAGWLIIQAVPLLAFPSMIGALLSPEIHQSSSLEQYFARSLGLALVSLGIQCLFLTGLFSAAATSSSVSAVPSSTPSINVYAVSIALTTIFYHSMTSFYTYTWFYTTGQSAFMLAAIGSGSLGAIGLWSIMFGGGSRISSRTGADKRTSGWPFGNMEADKKRSTNKTH